MLLVGAGQLAALLLLVTFLDAGDAFGVVPMARSLGLRQGFVGGGLDKGRRMLTVGDDGRKSLTAVLSRDVKPPMRIGRMSSLCLMCGTFSHAQQASIHLLLCSDQN